MNVRSSTRLIAGWLSCIAAIVSVATSDGLQVNGQEKPTESSTAQAQGARVNIPDLIQFEAKRRGVELSSIKQQGEYWVACEGEDAGAACIVLGKVVSTVSAPAPMPVKLTGLSSGTVLEVHRYGQAVQSFPVTQKNELGRVSRDVNQRLSFELHAGVEARVSVQGRRDQFVDTLPRYRREANNLVRTKDFQLVRNYIDARPNEPFAVIVTVPALCEPCRRLDKLIHDTMQRTGSAAANGDALSMKLFILEYFTFAEAEREVLGPGAVFPTTLIFGAEAQPRRSISRLIGNLRGSSFEEISRPLTERFQRGSPHTMSRGIVVQELLFQPQDQRLTQR